MTQPASLSVPGCIGDAAVGAATATDSPAPPKSAPEFRRSVIMARETALQMPGRHGSVCVCCFVSLEPYSACVALFSSY